MSKTTKTVTKKCVGSKTTKCTHLTKKCNGPLCKGKLRCVTDFHFANKAKGKRDSTCKFCKAHRRKNTRYTYPKNKKCPDCKIIMPIKKFNYRCKKNGEREKRCGKCSYAKRDKENRRQQHKNWYENNGGKEFVKNYNHEYKSRRSELDKERRKTDVNYHITMNVRHRIWEILKKHGMRGDHKIEYLGIDIQTYKDWLEYQFDDEMSWNNYGTYWHIDHVRPCSSFTFTSMKDSSVLECFNWKNTRPMVAKDNLAKGDKIDHAAIISQKIIVRLFTFEYSSSLDI